MIFRESNCAMPVIRWSSPQRTLKSIKFYPCFLLINFWSVLQNLKVDHNFEAFLNVSFVT